MSRYFKTTMKIGSKSSLEKTMNEFTKICGVCCFCFAAYTEIYEVDEVLIFHVLWL